MASAARDGIGLVKETLNRFLADRCPRMAAALSYYTIFSLPALVILLLLILGLLVDARDVRGNIESQIEGLVGAGGAEQVRTIIDQAQEPDAGWPLAAILALGALVFGATGAFIELQSALNRVWGVEPDPERGGVKTFITTRLFSLGMVLAIAFLLLVSLALSAILAGLGDTLGAMLPGGVSEILLQIINLLVSFAVITVLFAAMFKIIPDAVIAWRDVWVGALATAFLFVVGKFLIGLYLGGTDPGQAYGAAGSLVLILLWIYYSALILFLGAEFTQVWAERHGRDIEPEEGAVRVVEERRHVRESQAEG